MGKHIDEDDQKTLADFYTHLVDRGLVKVYDAVTCKREVAAFLAERAKKREASFGRDTRAGALLTGDESLSKEVSR